MRAYINTHTSYDTHTHTHTHSWHPTSTQARAPAHTETHVHTRTHTHDSFFARFEDFEAARKKRWQRLLTAYLDTLEPHVREGLLRDMRAVLQERGLHVPAA